MNYVLEMHPAKYGKGIVYRVLAGDYKIIAYGVTPQIGISEWQYISDKVWYYETYECGLTPSQTKA